MGEIHQTPSLVIEEHLTSRDVLELIGHHPESIKETASEVRAMCPIHGESDVRTLTVDKKTKRFRCSHPGCPGNAGGDLISLYARARKIGRGEATAKLNRHILREGRSHTVAVTGPSFGLRELLELVKSRPQMVAAALAAVALLVILVSLARCGPS
jgi:hypothetical protein